jgi:hypothetical protein
MAQQGIWKGVLLTNFKYLPKYQNIGQFDKTPNHLGVSLQFYNIFESVVEGEGKGIVRRGGTVPLFRPYPSLAIPELHIM